MSTLQTRSFGVPTRRSPVVDSIDPSDSTRSGLVMAIVWAIIPPMDTPVTCARSIPSSSRSPKRVVRHVLQQVGRPDREAGHRLHHVRHRAVDLRGQARVAVVEADHVEAALGQSLAELEFPVDQLHPEPHHEQQGRIGGIADRLVDELNLSDVCALFSHRPGRSTRVRENLTLNLKLLGRRKFGSLPSSSSFAVWPRAKRHPFPKSWNSEPAALVVLQPVDPARNQQLLAAVHVPQPRGDEARRARGLDLATRPIGMPSIVKGRWKRRWMIAVPVAALGRERDARIPAADRVDRPPRGRVAAARVHPQRPARRIVTVLGRQALPVLGPEAPTAAHPRRARSACTRRRCREGAACPRPSGTRRRNASLAEDGADDAEACCCRAGGPGLRAGARCARRAPP